MNSACGKVLGDFARSVLHHHRAVADPDHAIFGSEHGAEQDPGIRPDADRSTHHRGGRHAGAGVNPRCLAVPPADVRASMTTVAQVRLFCCFVAIAGELAHPSGPPDTTA